MNIINLFINHDYIWDKHEYFFIRTPLIDCGRISTISFLFPARTISNYFFFRVFHNVGFNTLVDRINMCRGAS